MNQKDKILAEELRRTIHWASKNEILWKYMTGIDGCELKANELAYTIDMLVEERQYVPLIILLLGDFSSIDSVKVVKRVLTDLIISQWDDSTWDIIAGTVKQVIAECFGEDGDWI